VEFHEAETVDARSVERAPLALLVAAAIGVPLSFLCWLMGGRAANLVGYLLGIVLVLVLTALFDRIDNARRRSIWYVVIPSASRANIVIRIAGLVVGVLNLWAFATAIAR
jgi:hypothetical protein